MKNIITPKTQNAEVLFELIFNKQISRATIFRETSILNLPARIHDLRKKFGIDIICDWIKTENKHGRKIRYGVWSLTDKQKAKLVYEKINLIES